MKHIERYFKRRGIEVEHILYSYRTERNLVICMDSGDEISCSMLTRELIEHIPMDEFVLLRKGVVIRKSGILAISDEGIYTKLDGKTF